MLSAVLLYWHLLPADRRSNFRFHHVSTDEVFGALGAEGYFDEQTPYNPRSPYATSKAASEHPVNAWHHTYHLPVLITNCSNNYGPFHFPENLSRLPLSNALLVNRFRSTGKAIIFGIGYTLMITFVHCKMSLKIASWAKVI